MVQREVELFTGVYEDAADAAGYISRVPVTAATMSPQHLFGHDIAYYEHVGSPGLVILNKSTLSRASLPCESL